MDNLKLKQLKKHYANEEEAIKHAIINELNRSYNMYGTRRFLYIEEIEEIEDYFKVEVIYIDNFISSTVRDKGIYYISKEVI